MEDEKKKKIIIISLIGVGALVAILIAILLIVSYMNGQKNNIIIDGISRKMGNTIVYIDDTGNPFICVENLTPLLGTYKDGGYNFYNGEKDKGTEDRTKCYVENKYEVATISMDSNRIYKALLEDTSMYDSYSITNPVKRFNDKLYISLEGMQIMFNLKYKYDSEKNILIINTLPYLVKQSNAIAAQMGYTSLAEEFTNQKALVYDMLVVLKDRKHYGVLAKDGTVKIGAKYEKIEFAESGREFIVTADKKLGVLTSEANTKIPMSYDELKIIDNEIGLYLVKSGSKYGVLDRNGNTLIYLDYEYIGIQNVKQFPSNDIKNPYILYDNCIPVCKGGKWGMFDVNGKELLSPQYSGFGCISSTQKNALGQNVLLIPASEGQEGIVVSKVNYANATKYGIVNTQGKLITSTGFNKIYMEISSGTADYYMVFGTTITRVRDRINTENSEVNNNGTVQINSITGGSTPITGNNSVVVIDDQNTTNEITAIQ